MSDDQQTIPPSGQSARKPNGIIAILGVVAIVFGLVVGLAFGVLTLTFATIENAAPMESIAAGLFGIGTLLAGLQVIAGIGLLGRQRWGMNLTQPAAMGLVVVTLIGWVPLFIQGLSLVVLVVLSVFVVGYVIALKVVLNLATDT